jgi:predicted flap endonuclease-1-like 5' DNA nuclease
MTSVVVVEGIGEAYAQKLRVIGVSTCEKLLARGASPQGRKEIADKTGIPDKLILEWVNHVDLFRIKGVQQEYADLLEEAGVDTVPELAKRNATNLHEKLVVVNEAKSLVRQLPTPARVADWIEQARHLPRVITY